MSAKQKAKQQEKKMGWLKRLVLYSNIVFALALVCCFFAGYISPAKAWLFSFFGISFLVLFFINLMYFILYAFSLRWYALISLTALALNYQNIITTFNVGSSSDKNDAKSINILTYNVNLFDYYQSRNKGFGTTKTKLLELVEEQAADILCFQEYLETKDHKFPVSEVIAQKMNLTYKTTLNHNQRFNFGTVIFSKYPILSQGFVEFTPKSTNTCIYADLLVGVDTLRVYNFHLQSINFNKEDEIFYKEFINNTPNDNIEIRKNAFKMLNKMKAAFVLRAPQSETLAAHIAKSPYPVVVCGDMNDTPSSYAYKKVSQHLVDAFNKKGFGFGSTYRGLFPSFRIDYIFHSPDMATLSCKSVSSGLSDHIPLIAKVEFKKNDQQN